MKKELDFIGIAEDKIKADAKKIPIAVMQPEQQKHARVFRPLIDLHACKNNYNCIIFCPHGAISRNEKGRPQIDYNLCTGCLICLRECPAAAIKEEVELK